MAKSQRKGITVLCLAVILLWRPSCFLGPVTGNFGRRAMLGALLAPALRPLASSAEVPAWQGAYEDPDHPGCKREVRVEGLNVKIDAAEGKPGCGNGEKERPWSVTGKLSLAAYNEMILDFRPRGGPERLIVRWEGNAIRFPEGQFQGKWTKKATLS
mmetsp:Transcript_171/g.403  ORF Transcript_171/g.403 Transcript_171/m.403 type:complete len:157 (-) Transcript_171:55-525(-)